MFLQVYSFGDKDKELVDTLLVLCVLIPQPRYMSASDGKLSSSTLNRASGQIAPRFFRFSTAPGFPLDSRLTVRQHFDQPHPFPFLLHTPKLLSLLFSSLVEIHRGTPISHSLKWAVRGCTSCDIC